MENKDLLGHIGALEISAKRSAFVAFVLIWFALSVIGFLVFRFSILEAALSGFIITCLHYLSELIHQLGHAGAARNTGYPMRGIRFVHVLAFSLYPKDEPELSGRIHIRRALGGPLVSFLVTVVALLILLVAQNVGGMFYWIALCFFLDNLFVFTLGAFLPLPFTDGGAIARYWGKP
jgi:hypothetical protein